MSTTASYVPQPGTVPAAAILALAKAEGYKLSTAMLLEAIGQPLSSADLFDGYMLQCLSSGLVTRERIATGIVFWHLSDPGVLTAQDLQNDITPRPAVKRAPRAVPRESAPSNPEAKPEVSAPAAEPVDADVPIGDTPGVELLEAAAEPVLEDYALTKNGRLLLRIDGKNIAIDLAETTEFFAYTDAVRGLAWEAA